MDPNNNPSQNSSNYPFNYQIPTNYQLQNLSSNQPQNVPNYGFPPNFFMPSAIPNYHPYYGSMMPYPSQTAHISSTSTSNEIVSNVGPIDFPEFSTQMALGGMNDVHENSSNAKESTHARQKSGKWTTEENLVLLSGWIKYGTDSIVGRNQKGESYWGKIADYCNEHCSFDPPRDGNSCRNHYNYMNKILGKWIGAYDNAKRMQQSGWSENDVFEKAQELYSSGGNKNFKLVKEWHAVRDQPRYGSQVGGNTGSASSGSKRSRDSDASDANSVGSSVRPMGRDAAKKKGKKKGKAAALEALNTEWIAFEQLKKQEMERLDKISLDMEEANKIKEKETKVIDEANKIKKMEMYLKLTEKEHLNDRQIKILEELTKDLFGN